MKTPNFLWDNHFVFPNTGTALMTVPKVASSSLREVFKRSRVSYYCCSAQTVLNTSNNIVAFVRHPMRRMESAYRNKILRGHPEHLIPGFDKEMSFEDFVVKAVQKRYEEMHFFPQVDWLSDHEGVYIPNRTHKIEHIEREWCSIVEEGLNLDLKALPGLPFINASNDTHSLHWVPSVVSMFYEAYAKDFDFLGYGS